MKKTLAFVFVFLTVCSLNAQAAFKNPMVKKDMKMKNAKNVKTFSTINLAFSFGIPSWSPQSIRYYMEYQEDRDLNYTYGQSAPYKLEFTAGGSDERLYHTAVINGEELELIRIGDLNGPGTYILYLSDWELNQAFSQGALSVELIGQRGNSQILFPSYYLEYVLEKVRGPGYLAVERTSNNLSYIGSSLSIAVYSRPAVYRPVRVYYPARPVYISRPVVRPIVINRPLVIARPPAVKPPTSNPPVNGGAGAETGQHKETSSNGHKRQSGASSTLSQSERSGTQSSVQNSKQTIVRGASEKTRSGKR